MRTMTHACETWLIHVRYDSFTWDMTHLYETWYKWVMSHVNEWKTWPIHVRHDSCMWSMTHVHETWLIHKKTWYETCLLHISLDPPKYDVPHSYVAWRKTTYALFFTCLDGYCSTVQGLLDWFEVDLGFTELSFIRIDLCVLCDTEHRQDIFTITYRVGCRV